MMFGSLFEILERKLLGRATISHQTIQIYKTPFLKLARSSEHKTVLFGRNHICNPFMTFSAHGMARYYNPEIHLPVENTYFYTSLFWNRTDYNFANLFADLVADLSIF